MSKGKYEIQMQFLPPWQVGYHEKINELFLYRVDDDGLTTVVRGGRVDSIFFEEFTQNNNWICLGWL